MTWLACLSQVRDHALERLRWTSQQCKAVDQKLEEARPQWPQIEALLELKGIGLFTALLIVGEFGDVTRFRTAKQAAAYRPFPVVRAPRQVAQARYASDEALACVVIMSGRALPVNCSWCDGARPRRIRGRTARMGDDACTLLTEQQGHRDTAINNPPSICCALCPGEVDPQIWTGGAFTLAPRSNEFLTWVILPF